MPLSGKEAIMKTATRTKRRRSAPAIETHGPVIRRHETWSAGDCAHQGDLIFVCLPKLPGSSAQRGNRQLADGETRGSKHVLVGGVCYDANKEEVARMIQAATRDKVKVNSDYVGPVFVGEATVEHPQHQHQAFPEGTVTACIYQRNLDAEEREIRARD